MGYRMKKICLILAVLAALSFVAREAAARMGETIAQCDQRYGAQKQSPVDISFPLISGVTNRTYTYQGWRIQIAFIKGRAAMLRYTKVTSQTIEDNEVRAILKAETYGGNWTEQSQFSLNPLNRLQNFISHPRLWTNDIGAEAYIENPSTVSFIIKAPIIEKYRKAQEARRDQQRKASIPEF